MATSTFRPSAAGLDAAWPPASSNASSAASRTSKPQVSKPARHRVLATPRPIEPRPMTPTVTSVAAMIDLSVRPRSTQPLEEHTHGGDAEEQRKRPAQPHPVHRVRQPLAERGEQHHPREETGRTSW